MKVETGATTVGETAALPEAACAPEKLPTPSTVISETFAVVRCNRTGCGLSALTTEGLAAKVTTTGEGACAEAVFCSCV